MVLFYLGFIVVRAIFQAYFLRAAIALFNRLFVRQAVPADGVSYSSAWDNRMGLVEETKFEDAFLFVLIGSALIGFVAMMSGAIFHEQVKPFIEGDSLHQAIGFALFGIPEYLIMSIIFKYFIGTTFARAFVIVFFQFLISSLVAGCILLLYIYVLA